MEGHIEAESLGREGHIEHVWGDVVRRSLASGGFMARGVYIKGCVGRGLGKRGSKVGVVVWRVRELGAFGEFACGCDCCCWE